MSEKRVVHVIVTGRVQGVGFRAWTHHQAELHGLSGWVRNRQDRTVEAVMAGPADAVAVMLKTLEKGPRLSRVDSVEVTETGAAMLREHDAETGFRVLRTF